MIGRRTRFSSTDAPVTVWELEGAGVMLSVGIDLKELGGSYVEMFEILTRD